jgi:hypothetical protein
MSKSAEILIGNRGSDFVSIRPGSYSAENWLGADVQVKCGGWTGGFAMSFMKGELERFAEDLRALQEDLSGRAEFKPLESYLKISFSGDGKRPLSYSRRSVFKLRCGYAAVFRL